MRPVLLNVLLGVIAGVPVLLCCSTARGQLGTPTAFTPEIGVVQSGTVDDVQATVSADRKYVTLTMRPQLSTLLALRSFTFQQGNMAGGFVGMPETDAGNSSTASRSNSQATPWVSARPSVSILLRTGMTRVSKPIPPPSNASTSPSNK